MNLLHGLDLLSTFVFALVGARVAADKRLDYGGIAFIAVIASVSGGTQLAFEQNISWYGAILLGLVTAVTGGLLRDVLCQLEPVLLHRETIGTSCLMGAITFVALTELSVANNISAIAGGSVVVLTRVLSIRFDLHLPKFKGAN
jgi:uncharacterized membrane protein YeiH